MTTEKQSTVARLSSQRHSARRRAQRRFHVLLATGAGHPQHRERRRFQSGCAHLLFQSGRVAGLGQRGDCSFRGNRLRCRESRRSYAHFLHFNARRRRKRMSNAAHAGPAVHVVDSQCKLRHEPLCVFDDSARQLVAVCGARWAWKADRACQAQGLCYD